MEKGDPNGTLLLLPSTAAVCKQEGCTQSRAQLPLGPALFSS